MSDKNLKEKEFNKEMKGLRKYLGEKFEAVNSDLGEIKTDVAVIETKQDHQQKHIDNLEDKMDAQKSRSDLWDRVNTAVAIAAGVIGSIVRPGK
jgi:ABC-type phosphate transport system ATPase subunit